ncbi:hypothetical protein [Desulfamplus magnetovallimortis]|uniref:hypothetical protein n=1 Tax=Desulfamplus magnetovallimortis TaxID=1246637 RepID=UPI00111B645C|nr:hypothetical protein [Desulfamplus magnetovallimortis]
MQKEEGLQNAQIAENMGESEDSINKLSKLIKNVPWPEILFFAKAYQEGRGHSKEPIGHFTNFTEGWFRNSGMTEIPGAAVVVSICYAYYAHPKKEIPLPGRRRNTRGGGHDRYIQIWTDRFLRACVRGAG